VAGRELSAGDEQTLAGRYITEDNPHGHLLDLCCPLYEAHRMTSPTKKKIAKRPAGGEAYDLALEKITSSGLDLHDFEILGFEILDANVVPTLHKSFRARHALRINYYHPITRKPMVPWPSWPAFYRLRYLAQKAVQEFSDVTEKDKKKKDPKYVQEPDSGICAYFPMNVDWTDILKDADTPLIITEGEFKAAKACKEGFYTIGLGGVYSFRSSKLGVPFLKELEEVNWVKRYVYIVYDSDLRSNPHVCDALNELAEQLLERGALPHVVFLPDVVDEGKTGLDDYLVSLSNPTEMFAQFIRDTAQPLTLARTLFDLNKKVTYVRNPGMIISKVDGMKMSPNDFSGHAFSHQEHSEQLIKSDGSISMKAVPAAQAWLRWPLRHEVSRITYAPGKPQITAQNEWNSWNGWGCTPRKGDIGPFLELLKHLFTGAERDAMAWFLKWLAYPIQYPGTKLFTSVLFHGIHHGTGKSLIGYTMQKIYGENFTEIKEKDLHGNFNEWAENKQFILGDDVTGSDKRQDNEMLKNLITQRMLRLNPKFIRSYTVPDCINYYFTSNQPDTFFLEDHDRRGFIHEVLVGPLDESFYMDYVLWLDTTGGPSVFDYLLKIDLSDFNPSAPAFMTSAKQRMISDGKSDLGSWVQQLKDNPVNILKMGSIPLRSDFYTNKQLLAMYDPEGKTKVTANGLGRELKRAGFRQAIDGRQIRWAGGAERLYCVRNQASWANASESQIAKHLNETSKGLKRK